MLIKDANGKLLACHFQFLSLCPLIATQWPLAQRDKGKSTTDERIGDKEGQRRVDGYQCEGIESIQFSVKGPCDSA